MIALMPCAATHSISAAVLAGLARQSVPLDLYVNTSGGRPSRATEGVARTALVSAPVGIVAKTDIVLLIDSDVVLLDDRVVADLRSALVACPEAGLVAANNKPGLLVALDPLHVDIGCCCVRWEVLQDIRFSCPADRCHCLSVTEQLRARGYVPRYAIPEPGRAVHLERV